MKKNFYLLMMATFMGIATSCSSEEENGDSPGAGVDAMIEQALDDSISAIAVINKVYDIQENNVYQFKQGHNINTAEPNKYYYVCKDAKEAALFYNTYCTNSPQKVILENVGGSLVKKIDVSDRKSTFGKYGYTSLSIGDGSPEYATIEFSFKAVGDMHQLIFVPESFMPDNGEVPFISAYQLGDICLDQDNNQWLCVKEAVPATKLNKGYGYLVRLVKGDGKYWDRTSLTDHFKTVWFAEAKSGYTIAGTEAWANFCSIMEHRQGEDALAAMKNRTNGAFQDETTRLLRTVNNENEDWRIFQVGTVWHSDRDWCWGCWRYVWSISISYIVVHGKHDYYLGSVNTAHSLNDDNLKSTSLKGGCEMLEIPFHTAKIPGMRRIIPIYP